MNSRRRLPVFVILGLLLCACASYTVKSDTSPQADSSRYRKFGFSKMLASQEAPVEFNQITQGRVREAIQREMEARGYSASPEPDLLISIYLRVAKKQRIVDNRTYYGSPYYYGYYSGYQTGSVSTVDYREGTLIIDLVDTKANLLVWQGVAIGTLRENPKNIEKRINNVVTDIFKRYPFRAGESLKTTSAP